jgi:hypothetical protein
LIALLWFLAIYIVIYFILGIFYSSSPDKNSGLVAARVFDLMVLVFVLGTIVYYFFTLSDAQKKYELNNYAYGLKGYLENPASMFSLLLFIFVLYITIWIVGLPMSRNLKPLSITIIEGGAWILFAVSLIANFFKYVFGMNIMDSFYDWTNDLINSIPERSQGGDASISNSNTTYIVPKAPGSVNVPAPPKIDVTYASTDEVFNIGNNLYTYSDAKAICKSYGARLATYDEIEKAYTAGAEWCNYGWSEGQNIYYPTQKKTWEALQKDPKKKGLCGRPGVNGGYIKNPDLMVGVNCYGKKPKPNDAELSYMANNKGQIGPKTKDDKELDAKVDFWKKNSDVLLRINAFNNDNWSSV